MAPPNGAPQDHLGPPPVHVRVRGGSGRLAATLVVGGLAVVVASAVLGRGGDRPTASRAALEGSTARPTATQTPWLTPQSTPSATAGASPAVSDRGEPLPDLAGVLPGDDGIGPLPLGTIDEVPNADRLDFLFEFCRPGCERDAHWMDPLDPKMGSGVWTAGRPFHVREGFINDRTEPLGEGFDVVLYVTRVETGPEPVYRYASDYVLRGTTDRCGPTYRTQTAPSTCEWFVHDFPEGLPEGRFAITAVWEAPCQAWVDLGVTASCEDPDEVISLFTSGVNAPYGPWAPRYDEQSS